MRTRSASSGSASDGIALGQPLEEFQGVLRGVPTYVGSEPCAADRRTAGDVTDAQTRPSERTLILAPLGRDAAVAGSILTRGRHPLP